MAKRSKPKEAAESKDAPRRSGEKEFLDRYDMADYPAVAVAVDVVCFAYEQDELWVGLVRRGGHPEAGKLALPGGFVLEDEDLIDAARRELLEELDVSLDDGVVEQLATFGAPGRDPRGRIVSVAYLALLPERTALTSGGDAAAAAWVALDDLDAGDVAFDHVAILATARERLASKMEYSTIAFALLRAPFTFPELQTLYERVWGADVDAGNFRRKCRSAGIVVETGDVVSSGAGRPAALLAPARPGEVCVFGPAIARPEVDPD